VKRLIPVEVGDDTSILVEVEQLTDEEAIDIGLAESTQKVRETLADSVEKMLPVAKMIVQKMRSLPQEPSEIEVAFGFSLSAQAGAFIASSQAQANFALLLRWSKSE
jgi:hypothetical protein